MIPAQHKPTLFGFCDKQQNHLTRLLSGLACCTATFLCIYIDCLAVKESPITQLDVLLTSRGNTACQRQVSKLYYTSYQVYVINKYINTVYHILYTNINQWIILALQSKQLFPHLRPTQTSARNMINSSSKDDPWVAATCAEDFIGAPNTSTVGREINHHPQFEIAAPHIEGKWLINWYWLPEERIRTFSARASNKLSCKSSSM